MLKLCVCTFYVCSKMLKVKISSGFFFPLSPKLTRNRRSRQNRECRCSAGGQTTCTHAASAPHQPSLQPICRGGRRRNVKKLFPAQANSIPDSGISRKACRATANGGEDAGDLAGGKEIGCNSGNNLVADGAPCLGRTHERRQQEELRERHVDKRTENVLLGGSFEFPILSHEFFSND